MILLLFFSWITLTLSMDIVVPAYFYPEGKGLKYWNDLATTATSGQIPLVVVINPESGPGKRLDSDYAAINLKVRKAGAKTIGYIYSLYGRRPFADFVADVKAYMEWYAVDGFFIDEMSDNVNTIAYYRTLYTFIKSVNPNFVVINNPGTTIPQDFLTSRVADRFMIYESSQKSYASYSQQYWLSSYPPETFIHLVYNATAAQMTADITFAKKKGIGGVYITDDKLPNPYDTLPSYWNEEVVVVKNINTNG